MKKSVIIICAIIVFTYICGYIGVRRYSLLQSLVMDNLDDGSGEVIIVRTHTGKRVVKNAVVNILYYGYYPLRLVEESMGEKALRVTEGL
jgi:hypothetical protein